jgi:hypothetical protein
LTNKDAIAERGWGPMNYVLLDHSELKSNHDRVNMVNFNDDGDRYYPQESLHNLNTTYGMAGDALDLFLEERSLCEVLIGVDRATQGKHCQYTRNLTKVNASPSDSGPPLGTTVLTQK